MLFIKTKIKNLNVKIFFFFPINKGFEFVYYNIKVVLAHVYQIII